MGRFFLFLVFPCFLLAQKSYERAPINYETSEAIDAVSDYFSSGKSLDDWKSQGPTGYLKSFLDAFDIPEESQVLVYSKTSLQSGLISPQTPRAIYFNDEIYVGWVPGGSILEISVPSPTTGTNFYTLSNRQNHPELLRETHDCLRCHGGSFTRDIPGHVIRSVFPEPSGQPVYKAGTKVVNQSTPIEDRWGGWIVTGSDTPHQGNKLFEETDRGAALKTEYTIEDVPDNGYITRTSDIVALMVLEHQAEAHTLIAGLAIQTIKALHDQKVMDELLDRTEPVSGSTRRRIKHAADKLLKCLFYVDEAVMPKVDLSASAFAAAFQEDTPSDTSGRSLYQLKMDTRMFRYPLSYLVYSDAVADLPREALAYLWPETLRILESSENEPGYEHLSQRDKRDILRILRQTHPDFEVPNSEKAASKNELGFIQRVSKF